MRTGIPKAKGFCKSCRCKPCMCKEIAEARKNGPTHCEVCEQPLVLRGGYAGLGMCGPCTTGEADTIWDA